MRKRQSVSKAYPFYVNLPLAATSTKGSIYKRFDIVKQEWALVEYGENPRKVRSRGPFTLMFQYPYHGQLKVKTVNASKER